MTEWGQDQNPTRQVFVLRTKRVYYLLLSILFLAVASASAWYGLPYLLKREPGGWREVIEEKYQSAYDKKYSFEIVLPSFENSSEVTVQIRRKASSEQRYPSPFIMEKDADEVFAAGKLGAQFYKNENRSVRVHIELLNTRLLGMDETGVDPIRIFIRLESEGVSTGSMAQQFFRGEQRGFHVPNHQKWKGNELRFMTLNSQDTGGMYSYDFVVVLSSPD